MSLRARSWPLELATDLVDLLPATDGLAWLQGDDGLVGWGEAARITPGQGQQRIQGGEAAFAALVADATIEDPVGIAGSGLVALGSFTFDARSAGSVLIVPEVVVGRRAGRGWVTRVTSDGTAPTHPDLDRLAATPTPAADRPRYAGSSMPDVHWLEAVAEAVRRIQAGRLDKVVLARDVAVWARAPFPVRDLTRRLNRRFPGCLTFVVDGLVGATPELLIRKQGAEVTSLALAGSARRGRDEDEDEALGTALRTSAKDRWEHQLAAATVAEALEPRCAALEHPSEPALLRLDNVMHLATRFHGTLAHPAADTALTLAAAMHPTAAVGGTPTELAVEMIRELEGMDRGRYAGPVGWVDAHGDGEWGIALRCAELSGARARLFAGAGIVADSLPEDELEETRLKLQAMRRALDELSPDHSPDG